MTEAECYFCGEGFEEGEDRHTPNENKLAECHAACCDEPGCKEEDVTGPIGISYLPV